MIEAKSTIPTFVRKAFESFLNCGVLERGFILLFCGRYHPAWGGWPLQLRFSGCVSSTGDTSLTTQGLLETIWRCTFALYDRRSWPSEL